MKQVEIFKTNVCEASKASLVISLLDECYPHYTSNFDMDDNDKILRVESIEKQIDNREIEALLNSIGIYCEVFKD